MTPEQTNTALLEQIAASLLRIEELLGGSVKSSQADANLLSSIAEVFRSKPFSAAEVVRMAATK